MRDIKGYEGEYAVTSCGRIWSYKSKKFLKTRKQRDGYYLVNLSKNGVSTTYQLHRLVAQAYLSNGDDLPQINHKNGDKSKNYVNNLEYCSASYNQLHKYKLMRERGVEIKMNINKMHNMKRVRCIETGIIYMSGAECARAMGLDPSHVSKCCRGLAKSHKGYHFEFLTDEENEAYNEKVLEDELVTTGDFCVR